MPYRPTPPDEFRRRFAAWIRLEPRCRSDDFSEGLGAEIADPLWFLARQWQFGELDAEDAGSPIEVDCEYSTQDISTVQLGLDGQPQDLADTPLEPMVENEPLPMDWRRRAQIGQQLERLTKQNLPANDADGLIAAWRTAFPYEAPADNDWDQLDLATRRFVKVVSGKVIDGAKFLAAVSNASLPQIAIDPALISGILDALSSWIKATGRHGDEPPSSWYQEQLEYRFKLNPPASAHPKTQLVAPSYQSGELDWHTFQIEGAPQGNWKPHASAKAYPTRITVTGLSPRWWAFEDGNTNFGDLHVEKTDLAKLALIEFALIYGDDWFSTPMPIEMGQLARVDGVMVKNVFGETHSLNSAHNHATRSADRWEMFTLTQSDKIFEPGAELLFIPPLMADREESPPLEEIRLIRDEGANLVWAIERYVLDGRGRPVDGFDAQREAGERLRQARISELRAREGELETLLSLSGIPEADRDAHSAELSQVREELIGFERAPYAPEPAGEGTLRFRLATAVPENWIPFIPVDAGMYFGRSERNIRLQRGQMLRNREADAPEPIQANSRLLEGVSPLLWLEEEAVTREGTRLVLTRHRGRATDGKTYVWTGRKARIGRGEGRSGLRFDVVQHILTKDGGTE